MLTVHISRKWVSAQLFYHRAEFDPDPHFVLIAQPLTLIPPLLLLLRLITATAVAVADKQLITDAEPGHLTPEAAASGAGF